MADESDPTDFLRQAYGPDSRSTADVMAQYQAPVKSWGGLKSYLPDQPEWMKTMQGYVGRGLAAIPPEAMLALNFLGRTPAKLPPAPLPAPPLPKSLAAESIRAPDPSAFMRDIQSRDIAAANDVSLRWNPDQKWLDILHKNAPVGRTFVTPTPRSGYLDRGTGNTHTSEPVDSFILGPKVEPEFRKQGIATAVYDALGALGQEHGLNHMPGMSLSPAAFSLWQKRDPSLLTAAMAREGVHGTGLTPEQHMWLSKQSQPDGILEQAYGNRSEAAPSSGKLATRPGMRSVEDIHASFDPAFPSLPPLPRLNAAELAAMFVPGKGRVPIIQKSAKTGIHGETFYDMHLPEIGFVGRLKVHPDNSVGNIWIDEPYRRQGLASYLYDYAARDIGVPALGVGSYQTPAGRALRDAYEKRR